jgi:translation initiation factor 5B
MTSEKIRAPILTTLGHVNHGKTTLLDCIRGTTIARKEPGQITQHVGASFIPIETVKRICGELLNRFKIKITIPGLLIIDTPGHEAFTTLRKRGGSVADLAILVIDINEGFQPQTDESLEYLKQFKVPFIVAATKIDLINGWYPHKNSCFLDTFPKQSDYTKEKLENKLYELVAQLGERGFEAERFDRVIDFTKQIAIVPCSGKTGEGVAEVLLMLTGLAQKFLKKKLSLSNICRGNILEVKEIRGLGVTIDVIIYDGSVRVGDYIIIGGKEPLVTKIKALLRPPVLKELRVEKQFESVKEVNAAAGIKIAAPNLENVIAGSPIICVSNENEIEKAKKLIQQEVEEVEFARDVEGVIIKADTLGSLEALIKMLTDRGIPIRKAEVGRVNKQDVVEVQNVEDDLRRVILAFNVKPLEEAESLATGLKVKIFQNNIIYRLLEDYEKWCIEEKERKQKEKLERVVRPCKLRFLPEFVFRKSKPAIFGVEVLAGVLKPGTLLRRKDGKIVAKVKEIQSQGKNIQEARTGDKVAISLPDVTVGRQVKEGDILTSVIGREDIKILKEVWNKLQDDEKKLLEEWKLV